MRQRLRRKAARISSVLVSTEDPPPPHESGPGEWTLVFADDETVQALNRDYRELDETTDVLSFALEDDDLAPQLPDAERLLGDVIVSVEQAQRQTPDTLEQELLRLLAHGYCHLLGYDHVDPAAMTAMLEAESGLLELFGERSGLLERASLAESP